MNNLAEQMEKDQEEILDKTENIKSLAYQIKNLSTLNKSFGIFLRLARISYILKD